MIKTYTWINGIVLAVAGLLASHPMRAQVPAWQSVIGVGPGTSTYSEIDATAVDASGNVYVAGSFNGTIQVGTATLTSAGLDEIFVAKWSAITRSYVWAMRAGGADIDYPTAIAVNGSSVYLVGAFNSPLATFGGLTLTNANPVRSADLFVAKLTDAGSSASFTWAQRAGGSESESVDALAVSGSNVYLAGTFASPTLTLGTTTLIDFAKRDVFVAKLVDNGTTSAFAWAERGGGRDDDEAKGLAVSGNSLYLTGNFEGSIIFGTSGPSVTSAGGLDIFVTKLTDNGSRATYNWVQRGGGPDNDYVRALATNGQNVYVAGEFVGATATFGPTTLANASTGRATDGFMAKLVDNIGTGNFEWAQDLGGAGYDQADAIAIRGAHVYVAGTFDSATLPLGTTTLVNGGAAGTSDAYVAHLLDTGGAGSFVWGQRAGSVDNDYARTLAMAGTRLYVAGSVRTPASFGSQTLAGASTVPVAFFATLDDALSLATATSGALAGFYFYPNPASGTAIVQVPAVAGNVAATLTVIDAVGCVIRVALVPSGQAYALNLAGLLPGVYALRVQVGETQATQKLVVQ